MAGKNDRKLRCTICGKPQAQESRMISGPTRKNISDQ